MFRSRLFFLWFASRVVGSACVAGSSRQSAAWLGCAKKREVRCGTVAVGGGWRDP